MERQIGENEIDITLRLFMEGMTGISGQEYRKGMRRAVIALAALWLFLLGVALWGGGNLGIVAAELGIIGVLCLWVLVLQPRWRLYRAYQAMRKKSGGNMHRRVRLYKSCFRVENGIGEKEIPYEQVERVVETKHLLVLVCQGKLGFLLLKEGFIQGDARTLREHIENARENMR